MSRTCTPLRSDEGVGRDVSFFDFAANHFPDAFGAVVGLGLRFEAAEDGADRGAIGLLGVFAVDARVGANPFNGVGIFAEQCFQ